MNKFEPERHGRAVPIHQAGHGPLGLYQPSREYDGATYGADDEERIDLLKLLRYLLRYRWLIAVFLVAGLLVGILATYLQTPFYRATADVEILTSGARVFQDLDVVSQSSDIRAFETSREKMLSRELARRVVFRLDLADNEEFLAPTPSFSLMNLVYRATGGGPKAALGEYTAEERQAMAVERLMDNLAVALVPNTSILSVSFSHPDPVFAARIANQVVGSYVDQSVDRKAELSELARQFINEQVRESEERLQKSEKALLAYARKAGLAAAGRETSLIAENMAEINKALGKAIEERIVADAAYDQVRQGNAASLPAVFASKSIEETKQKIAELEATYQHKLGTLKPAFPEMQHLRAEIVALQEQINAEVAAIGRSVEMRYEQARRKVAGLERELANLEARQANYRDKRIRYDILKREVESNRKQYESLVEKLNEVGVGSDLKTTNASLVDPAVVPRLPYTPRLYRNVALVVALFAAMAAVLIYLLELMRNSFATPEQIESELRLTVLGILPAVADRDFATAFDDNRSAISEAFRSLRTSLQFTGTERSMRTVLVTSAEQGEGKSTVAFKLAQDFAVLGKKVLIMDADLRKPRMHRLFDRSNAIGLSNLLSNVVQKSDVRSIFLETEAPGITLLPAGTIPPNPVELLMSPRMGLALNQCADIYDLVIIDGPPVLGLSDALILSRQADATLLVVSANQVTRRSAKTALARLRGAGGNVVGAALNRFTVDRFAYNRAYGYLHYNYYGYPAAPTGPEDHASPDSSKADYIAKAARALSHMLGGLRRRFG